MNRVAKAGVVVFSVTLAAAYVVSQGGGQIFPSSKSGRVVHSDETAASQPSSAPSDAVLPGSKSFQIFPGNEASAPTTTMPANGKFESDVRLRQPRMLPGSKSAPVFAEDFPAPAAANATTTPSPTEQSRQEAFELKAK